MMSGPSQLDSWKSPQRESLDRASPSCSYSLLAEESPLSPEKHQQVPLPTWVKNVVKRAYKRIAKRSMECAERHWALSSILFFVTVVVVCVAMGWTLRLKSFRGNQVLDDRIPEYNSLWVGLYAHIVSVDSDDQSITMDWEGWYYCPEDASPGSEECPDVSIYFDMGLVRRDSSTSLNNEKPPPVFTLNATDYHARNVSRPSYRSNSCTFRMMLAMTNFYRTDGRSIQAYPFDKYSSTVIFWAESARNSNQSVTIGLIDTTGIAPGFNAQMELDTSGIAPYGVKVKNFTVYTELGHQDDKVIQNCVTGIVTMTFLLICVISVFLGKGIKTEVLVLPVTNLFAFTQLRSTMPGAPSGFGADIDFIGVLPCLVLLTFSSVFMCAVFLFRDPEKHARGWTERHREAAHEKLSSTTA